MRTKLKEQHEKANCAEYSLDDHIIDYELRRVKERRAHEEVLSGRYRHPAFIARTSQGFISLPTLFELFNREALSVDSSSKFSAILSFSFLFFLIKSNQIEKKT